jgi:predicted transcriptional regulator
VSRDLDKHFGRGFYRRLLKLGEAAGRDASEVARELGVLEEDVNKRARDFYNEVKALEVHRQVVDQLRSDLLRVRLAAAEQDIIEDLLANLEDLRPREKIELLKHIKSAIPEVRADGGKKKLSPEEAEKRLAALAASHLKAVK